MRFHYICIKAVKKKRVIISSADEDGDKLDLSYIVGGNVKG